MERIIKRIKREIAVFQELDRRTRLLLVCMGLFTLGGCFLGVFLNIYLWRALNNLRSVALFNLFFFVGLPIGFIVNGLLLRKISYVSAFRFGILAQGVFPLIIISLQEGMSQYLIPLGLIKGFGEAIFWANLNLFIFDITSDKIRGYYTGLQEALSSAIWMVGPPLGGFVIGVFGQGWLRLNIQASYYLSFSIAAFIFFLAVVIAGKIEVAKERLDFSLRDISFENLSKNWLTVRLMSIFSGFPIGIFALTWSVLVFEFFGREFEVGWFNGFLGMVGVVAAYFAGRLARPERRLMVITVGTVFFFIGTVIFGFNFSLPALFLLGILAGTGDVFIWTVEYPVLMREMEKGYLPKGKRYKYWLDRAIFGNLGRIFGLIIFIFLTSLFAFEAVYRLMFIAIAFSSIVFLLTIKKLIEADR